MIPNQLKSLAIHRAKVVENADPLGLGRVRIMIPGFLEPESAWAGPLASSGGGAAQLGSYNIPVIGANVAVFFDGGDIDYPMYMPGLWARPSEGGEQTPTDPLAAFNEEGPEAAVKVRSQETESFVITMDEREGRELFQMRHKESGDIIEFDGVNRGITVKGSTAVLIQSQGLIELDAPIVSINGRTVWPGNEAI